MRITYRKLITKFVIAEYDTTQKFYMIKNQYTQVHIGTLSQTKYF